MNERTGSCSCGEIEYTTQGEPSNVAFCYCTECQKHTNSDKWLGLWFQKDRFHITKGSAATFTRQGDSGKNMIHHFCANCGVNLAVFVEIGDFYSVAGNTLHSSEIPKPKMLIYTKHAASWALYPEDVPKFEIVPPEMM